MSGKKYPYVNHMNILYDALQLVDVPKLVEECADQWYNQTLCKVNESVVRLGIVKGEYHWHKHDEEDEDQHQRALPFLTNSNLFFG